MPSGIPDFRTPGDGALGEGRPDGGRAHRRLPSATRPASGASTGRASRRSATSEPNGAHEALAELERRGLLEARDHPEHRPPAPQGRARERVIEVHGSIETVELPALRRELPRSRRSRRSSTTTGSRSAAGCGGPVKPDVVLFGELLPGEAMARGRGAGRPRRPDALRRLLARGLPGRRAARGDAAAAAAGIAIITKGPTPYDGDADGAPGRRRRRRPRGRAGGPRGEVDP